VFRSKRKGSPHVIARIRKHATSRLAHQYLGSLRQELAEKPEKAATVGCAARSPLRSMRSGTCGGAASAAAQPRRSN
jgi:hypothetical protein